MFCGTYNLDNFILITYSSYFPPYPLMWIFALILFQFIYLVFFNSRSIHYYRNSVNYTMLKFRKELYQISFVLEFTKSGDNKRQVGKWLLLFKSFNTKSKTSSCFSHGKHTLNIIHTSLETTVFSITRLLHAWITMYNIMIKKAKNAHVIHLNPIILLFSCRNYKRPGNNSYWNYFQLDAPLSCYKYLSLLIVGWSGTALVCS